MNKLAFIPVALACAGCTSPTFHYDHQFGESVRAARASQVIDPQAGSRPDPVAGIDGKAARETVNLYHGSFKEPPPVVNVINIGGAVAGSGGK